MTLAHPTDYCCELGPEVRSLLWFIIIALCDVLRELFHEKLSHFPNVLSHLDAHYI
jgi:hypothetical protein